jgi:hypothetical protein
MAGWWYSWCGVLTQLMHLTACCAGLQESIRDLRQGQRVLLVKEPGNPYDPHAVQVLTLTGQSLGYVPRPDPQKRVRGDCTNKDITLGMQIGCVASVGQVQDPPDGPWGATVFTQPGLISLTADPLPPAKRQPALQQFVQKCSSENSRLVRQALEVAQGSCEVTGVPGGSGGSAGEQLVPMPVWHWDSHNKVSLSPCLERVDNIAAQSIIDTLT